MPADLREGPIHLRVRGIVNACICGWTCTPGAAAACGMEWIHHRDAVLQLFPQNHQALIHYEPRTKSRSAYYEIVCSCGTVLTLKNGDPETFYTLQHMCDRFLHHVGEAKDAESANQGDRMQALSEQRKAREKALDEEQRKRLDHEGALRARKAIQDRFVLADE